MRVRVLGTAAGGGLPQWNCGCPTCAGARTAGIGRTQDGLAVTAGDAGWYLVNASADLRLQLLAAPELAPAPATRDPPIRGVLLTSAELDHTVGLLGLREAAQLTVYATATVARAVPFRDALAAYTAIDWRTVVPGAEFTLDGGLLVTAFAAGEKRPRFAADAEGREWTVAYRFADPRTGGVLVYAPGLAAWSAAFQDGVAGADVVLLDGTFERADEFPGPTGHLSMVDSLPHLRSGPGPRYLYTHLNNTNRFGVVDESAWPELAAAGARIAMDGEVLVL